MSAYLNYMTTHESLRTQVENLAEVTVPEGTTVEQAIAWLTAIRVYQRELAGHHNHYANKSGVSAEGRQRAMESHTVASDRASHALKEARRLKKLPKPAPDKDPVEAGQVFKHPKHDRRVLVESVGPDGYATVYPVNASGARMQGRRSQKKVGPDGKGLAFYVRDRETEAAVTRC